MSPEQTLAEQYADLARINFERDGTLHPVLTLCTADRSIICAMGESENLPVSYGRTLIAACSAVQPDFIITVTEVWMQQLPYTTAEEEFDAHARARELRRGDLERQHKLGDDTVRTALMTIAWSMDPRRAVAVTDCVQDDGTYDRHVSIGEQEGYMAECIIGGWQHGLNMPPPPVDLDDDLLAMLISVPGEVVSVLVQWV